MALVEINDLLYLSILGEAGSPREAQKLINGLLIEHVTEGHTSERLLQMGIPQDAVVALERCRLQTRHIRSSPPA